MKFPDGQCSPLCTIKIVVWKYKRTWQFEITYLFDAEHSFERGVYMCVCLCMLVKKFPVFIELKGLLPCS